MNISQSQDPENYLIRQNQIRRELELYSQYENKNPVMYDGEEESLQQIQDRIADLERKIDQKFSRIRQDPGPEDYMERKLAYLQEQNETLNDQLDRINRSQLFQSQRKAPLIRQQSPIVTKSKSPQMTQQNFNKQSNSHQTDTQTHHQLANVLEGLERRIKRNICKQVSLKNNACKIYNEIKHPKQDEYYLMRSDDGTYRKTDKIIQPDMNYDDYLKMKYRINKDTHNDNCTTLLHKGLPTKLIQY